MSNWALQDEISTCLILKPTNNMLAFARTQINERTYWETDRRFRTDEQYPEYGEGMDRMFREMEEAGCLVPEYQQNEFMVFVTIRQRWGAETMEKILNLISENSHITIEELARSCVLTLDEIYSHTKRLREKGF